MLQQLIEWGAGPTFSAFRDAILNIRNTFTELLLCALEVLVGVAEVLYFLVELLFDLGELLGG
jgi:hypothetical protein